MSFKDMMDNDATPSIEEVLINDAVYDYALFYQECNKQRASLDEALQDVVDEESLNKFLSEVDRMKFMYEKLKKLEDNIITEEDV